LSDRDFETLAPNASVCYRNVLTLLYFSYLLPFVVQHYHVQLTEFRILRGS